MCVGVLNAVKTILGLAGTAATTAVAVKNAKDSKEASKRAEQQAAEQKSALAEASRRAKGPEEADASKAKNERTDALSEAIRTTARGLEQAPTTKKKKLGE